MAEALQQISIDIHAWCQTAEKTVKAIRVYESNNEMLKQFIDRALEQIQIVHRELDEFTLGVREDRFCFGKEVVYENPDRQNGIPFLLYRNAIRRITFTRGFDRAELIQFFEALTADYNTFEYAGEDLVTILWRLRLPHLKYFAVEALSVAAGASADVSEEEKAQVEQIQNEVDELVASVYGLGASDENDLVDSVAISKEDLEALKEIRKESDEDLDLLDLATSRALSAISDEEMTRLNDERQTESHEILIERLIDILIVILFREKGGKDFAATMDLIQKLMDAVLFAGRYEQATKIIVRLRHTAEKADELKDMHVSRHLLKAMSLPATISPVLSVLDQQQDVADSDGICAFLRAFDQFVSATIVTCLSGLLDRNARKRLVHLLQEIGLQDTKILQTEMEGIKPVVMMDFLSIAEKISPKERAPLILHALEQDYPPLRIQALAMLLKFPRGAADEVLTASFSHRELEVRLKAYQVAAARRSAAARSTLRLMLLSDDLWNEKPREVRTLTSAYAAIAQEDAVLVLGKLLHPGFFAKKNVEVQVSAAFALAQIKSAPAQEQLKKGQKSINGKIREACKRAMIEGAGDANIATSLGEDLLISGFSEPEKQSEDVLKIAQNERRKQKNLATIESEELADAPLEAVAENEDDRFDHELFANVLKPHESADFMPENLMAAPNEKVSVGGQTETKVAAPSANPPPDAMPQARAPAKVDTVPVSAAPPSTKISAPTVPEAVPLAETQSLGFEPDWSGPVSPSAAAPLAVSPSAASPLAVSPLAVSPLAASPSAASPLAVIAPLDSRLSPPTVGSPSQLYRQVPIPAPPAPPAFPNAVAPGSQQTQPRPLHVGHPSPIIPGHPPPFINQVPIPALPHPLPVSSLPRPVHRPAPTSAPAGPVTHYSHGPPQFARPGMPPGPLPFQNAYSPGTNPPHVNPPILAPSPGANPPHVNPPILAPSPVAPAEVLPSGRETPKRSLSEDFHRRKKPRAESDSGRKDNYYSVAAEYEKKGDD